MDLPANARAGLILVRDLDGADAADRDLRRAADQGRLVRVQRGVYIDATEWRDLDDRMRHVARVRAAARTSVTEHVFTHESAAALHGIPLPGPFPLQVHLTLPRRSTAHSRRHIAVHRSDIPPNQIIREDGLLLTDACRTVVDLALANSFPTAVVAVDWWLQRGERSRLQECLDEMPPRTGATRAEAAIAFGDARSGSVGESLSRAVIHLLRLPAPELQVSFRDRAGQVGIVDFWWPAQQLIGEFDGKGKYLRDEFTQGRSADEVVIAEKVREDRLRALGPRVVRWGWGEATDPVKLNTVLTQAGLLPYASSAFRPN